MEFIVYRKVLTISEIKRLAKAGYYDEEQVKRFLEESSQQDNSTEKYTNEPTVENLRMSLMSLYPDEQRMSTSQNSREIWEVYVYTDVSGRGYDVLYHAEIDRGTEIAFRYTLYRDITSPILLVTFDSEDGKYYTAKSYVNYMASLAIAVNEMFNGRLNHTRLLTGLSGVYRAGSGFDPDEHIFGPKTWIPLRNPTSDLQPFKLPEMSQSSLLIEQYLNAYRQNFSGLLEQTTPSVSNVLRHRTFRGIAAVIEQGNLVISYRLNLLKPALDEMFRLIFKYTFEQEQEVITNINLLNISMDMRRQSIKEMMGILFAIPDIFKNPQAVRKLVEMYWNTFQLRGFEDVYPIATMGFEPEMLGMVRSPETALINRGGRPTISEEMMGNVME